MGSGRLSITLLFSFFFFFSLFASLQCFALYITNITTNKHMKCGWILRLTFQRILFFFCVYALVRSHTITRSLATQLWRKEKKLCCWLVAKPVALDFRMTSSSKKKRKTITTTAAARTPHQTHWNKCRKKVQVTQKYSRNDIIRGIIEVITV